MGVWAGGFGRGGSGSTETAGAAGDDGDLALEREERGKVWELDVVFGHCFVFLSFFFYTLLWRLLFAEAARRRAKWRRRACVSRIGWSGWWGGLRRRLGRSRRGKEVTAFRNGARTVCYSRRDESRGERRRRRMGAGVVGGAAIGASVGRCLLYTSPSPRDGLLSRMPSSA